MLRNAVWCTSSERAWTGGLAAQVACSARTHTHRAARPAQGWGLGTTGDQGGSRGIKGDHGGPRGPLWTTAYLPANVKTWSTEVLLGALSPQPSAHMQSLFHSKGGRPSKQATPGEREGLALAVYSPLLPPCSGRGCVTAATRCSSRCRHRSVCRRKRRCPTSEMCAQP